MSESDPSAVLLFNLSNVAHMAVRPPCNIQKIIEAPVGRPEPLGLTYSKDWWDFTTHRNANITCSNFNKSGCHGGGYSDDSCVLHETDCAKIYIHIVCLPIVVWHEFTDKLLSPIRQDRVYTFFKSGILQTNVRSDQISWCKRSRWISAPWSPTDIAVADDNQASTQQIMGIDR